MATLIEIKNESNEFKRNKNEDSISHKVNSSGKPFNLTAFDLSVLIFSVLSIIIDFCTDLVLVIHYNTQGYKAWAIGTFLLIFLPSVVVQFFSLRWHIVDKTASIWHWVFHICMLGIVHRYVQIIKAAFTSYKSKKPSDVEKVLFDQSDLCMLHLFESFLESAPQLVLQMYIIVRLHEWRFWTGVSALASLLSLAWALAAYTKAQRHARANKNSVTWAGLFLQAIWRTGMLTSRISTLVLGAYCFGNYIFLIITLHWLVMTIWIIHQKTDFCETHWEEKIYNAVVGVIYCFCFFNLQEGQSRWRALAFYLVIMFQNLLCLTIFLMWFREKTPKLAVFGFTAIVGGTIIGSASMLFYYRFFHPSGPIKFILTPQKPENTDPTSYSTMTLRSLKRIRCESQSGAAYKTSQQADVNDVNKSTLTDSVVVIEENVSDDSDVQIKILQDWISGGSNEKSTSSVNNKIESEADAYKRRAICSSVDLVKLIGSKADSETGSLKSVEVDEASTEILSAHDYENLCAVNITRETWGLRSWQGYSDIETWLHDDSVVHDRRLDTLTSTTSSDHSAITVQKGNQRMRQDDYMDALAEDLVQCESEASSDDALGQFSVESFPVSYSLGPLDPIFEEIEEASTNSGEFSDIKIKNGTASTLVATIDEIRRNTPIHNCYPASNSVYDGFSSLSDIKPKYQKMLKKVSFASKVLSFPEDNSGSSEQLKDISAQEKQKTKDIDLEVTKVENAEVKVEENICFKTKRKEKSIPVNMIFKSKINSKRELNNKENIPTVASRISHWNEILDSESEKKNGG